ncbi:MAG: response regulator [Bacteroidales bacterium]|nr:response regulator [Bacteroidales bacterium]
MERIKIFLVEDNRTENILLKLSLSSFVNISTQAFTNGKALINNLTSGPDIVIVDLVLPDISGLDLIKMIKEYDENIRIIVVSAQKDIDLIAKVQSEGIYNYIVKSDNCLEHLHTIISDLIAILKCRKTLKDIPLTEDNMYN